MPFRSSLKRVWQGKRIYVFIIAAGISLAAVFVYLDRFFEVRTIIVEPLSASDVDRLRSVKGISALYTRSMLFLPETEVKNMLLTQNPYVKDVNIYTKYPDTLEIHLDFFSRAAYLQVNSGVFLLAPNGRILEKSKTLEYSSLPLINYYQKLDYYSYQSGDVVDYKEIIMAMDFAESASEVGYMIGTIDINGLDMIVLNSKDIRFIFTTQKDPQEQKHQFSEIVKKFKMEGKDITVLDLRFDKPVVEVSPR